MAINSHNIQSLTAQCKIVWIPVIADYNITLLHQPASSNANKGALSFDTTNYFSNSLAFDISQHLVDGFSYSKYMDAAAGSFSFKLDNSRDWTATMHPGQWCLIYLANDGSLTLDSTKTGTPSNLIPNTSDLPLLTSNNDSQLQQSSNNLRCIGFIERISSSSSVGEDGSLTIEFEVSGRDFGIVYEDTELYFNHMIFEETQIQNILFDIFTDAKKQPLDQIMQILHDLFLFPQNNNIIRANAGPSNSLLTTGLQWLMPNRLLQILNLTENASSQSGPFYGSIDGITSFTPSLLPISITDPVAWLRGSMWGKLKEMSLPAFNELYTDVFEGQPQLIFRPIPWGIDKRGYPALAAGNGQQAFIPAYYNLASGAFDNSDILGFQSQNTISYMSDVNIISFNLGRDNHSRYNYFICKYADMQAVNETVQILQTNASPAGRQFPSMLQPDLMRFGLRLREEVVNSFSFVLAISGQNDLISRLRAAGNGEPSSQFLLQFNEVLRDYWQNAIFFETGSIDQFGDPNVKLGKVIVFGSNLAQIGNKVYYIEGYNDRFTIGSNGETQWTQSIQVTRGMDLTLLQAASAPNGIDTNISNPQLTQPEKQQLANPIVGSFVKRM